MKYKNIIQVKTVFTLLITLLFGTLANAAIISQPTENNTFSNDCQNSKTIDINSIDLELMAVQYPDNPILVAYTNAFVFSPRKLRWYAYDSRGRIIKSGRASGGKGYCADVKRSCRTPVGHFRVISKGSPGCRSSKYPLGKGGAPMPYCMFFSRYYAIHGSYDVPNYNASHGCIRVHPSAARWLHRNFIRHGTKVVVQPY